MERTEGTTDGSKKIGTAEEEAVEESEETGTEEEEKEGRKIRTVEEGAVEESDETDTEEEKEGREGVGVGREEMPESEKGNRRDEGSKVDIE